MSTDIIAVKLEDSPVEVEIECEPCPLELEIECEPSLFKFEVKEEEEEDEYAEDSVNVGGGELIKCEPEYGQDSEKDTEDGSLTSSLIMSSEEVMSENKIGPWNIVRKQGLVVKMAATKKGKWDEENMKKAVDGMLAGKFTLREAADCFSVPRSTLNDRVCAIRKGKSIKIAPSMGGFKQTFDDELEEELISHLKYLDSCFLPVNKTELLKIVYDLAEYLKLPHQFNRTKKTAGNKFYRGFIKRHPEFSLRCAQSTSLQRAQGFNKEQVDSFFNKLEELMNKYSFPPNKIFNCGETGVSVVHSNSQKLLPMKGKKQASKLTSGEQDRNITVMLCINAAGDQFIPPLFVFPRVQMDPQLTKGAPDGSIFDAQESGWISVSGFVKWLKAFIERVNPTEESPVLLILDGHSTHKDLQAILLAKRHHVHMLSLSPHTTHKLQPLDRAVMRPFKSAFNAACEEWMSKYGKLGLKITERDICGLVGTAFTKICRMELAKSGFQCTGIYPLNRNIFSDPDFLLATNTRKVAKGDGPEKPPAKTTNSNVNSLPQFPKVQ